MGLNKDRILWIVMMALILIGSLGSATQNESGWTIQGNNTATNYTAQVNQCIQFTTNTSYKVCLEEN